MDDESLLVLFHFFARTIKGDNDLRKLFHPNPHSPLHRVINVGLMFSMHILPPRCCCRGQNNFHEFNCIGSLLMSKGLGFMTAGLFDEILFLAIISNIVAFFSLFVYFVESL